MVYETLGGINSVFLTKEWSRRLWMYHSVTMSSTGNEALSVI